MAKSMHSDVIPLGFDRVTGKASLLVKPGYLKQLPDNASIGLLGGSGFHEISFYAKTNTDLVILRLLGFTANDIGR